MTPIVIMSTKLRSALRLIASGDVAIADGLYQPFGSFARVRRKFASRPLILRLVSSVKVAATRSGSLDLGTCEPVGYAYAEMRTAQRSTNKPIIHSYEDVESIRP